MPGLFGQDSVGSGLLADQAAGTSDLSQGGAPSQVAADQGALADSAVTSSFTTTGVLAPTSAADEQAAQIRALRQVLPPGAMDDPRVVNALVQPGQPIDQVITHARQTVGAVAVQTQLASLSKMAPGDQVKAWLAMNSVQQRALQANGYTPPHAQPTSMGFWQKLGHDVAAPVQGLASSMRSGNPLAVTAGITKASVGEVLGVSQAGRDLVRGGLDATGLPGMGMQARVSADLGQGFHDALQALGAPLRAVQHGYRDMDYMGNKYGIAGKYAHLFDTDAWDVTRSGESTFHPAATAHAENLLGGDPENTKIAELLASGHTLPEIIAKSGIPDNTDAARTAYADLLGRMQQPAMAAAVRALTLGKVSWGRDIAHLMGVNGGTSFNAVSGAFDAAGDWMLDPVMVAGHGLQAARMAGAIDTAHAGEQIELLRGQGLWNQVRSGGPLWEQLRAANGIDDVAPTWENTRDLRRADLAQRVTDANLPSPADGMGAYLGALQGSPLTGHERMATALADAARTDQLGALGRALPRWQAAIGRAADWAAEAKATGATVDANAVFDWMGKGSDGISDGGYQALARGEFGTYTSPSSLVVPKLSDTGLTRVLGRLGGRYTIAALAEMGAPDAEALVHAEDLGNVDRALGSRAANVLSYPAQALQALGTRAFTDVAVHLDGPEAFGQMDRMLAMGATDTERSMWLNRFFAAPNGPERAAVAKAAFQNVAARVGAYATEDGRQMVERFVANADQAYGLEGASLVPTADGGARVVGIAPKADYANAIAIPNQRELAKAVRQVNTIGGLFGSANELADPLISRVWKPAVLLRVGFIPRAVSEELIQTALRTPEALKETLGAKAAIGTYDPLFTKTVGSIGDVARVLLPGESGYATERLADHLAAAGAIGVRGIGHMLTDEAAIEGLRQYQQARGLKKDLAAAGQTLLAAHAGDDAEAFMRAYERYGDAFRAASADPAVQHAYTHLFASRSSWGVPDGIADLIGRTVPMAGDSGGVRILASGTSDFGAVDPADITTRYWAYRRYADDPMMTAMARAMANLGVDGTDASSLAGAAVGTRFAYEGEPNATLAALRDLFRSEPDFADSVYAWAKEPTETNLAVARGKAMRIEGGNEALSTLTAATPGARMAALAPEVAPGLGAPGTMRVAEGLLGLPPTEPGMVRLYRTPSSSALEHRFGEPGTDTDATILDHLRANGTFTPRDLDGVALHPNTWSTTAPTAAGPVDYVDVPTETMDRWRVGHHQPGTIEEQRYAGPPNEHTPVEEVLNRWWEESGHVDTDTYGVDPTGADHAQALDDDRMRIIRMATDIAPKYGVDPGDLARAADAELRHHHADYTAAASKLHADVWKHSFITHYDQVAPSALEDFLRFSRDLEPDELAAEAGRLAPLLGVPEDTLVAAGREEQAVEDAWQAGSRVSPHDVDMTNIHEVQRLVGERIPHGYIPVGPGGPFGDFAVLPDQVAQGHHTVFLAPHDAFAPGVLESATARAGQANTARREAGLAAMGDRDAARRAASAAFAHALTDPANGRYYTNFQATAADALTGEPVARPLTDGTRRVYTIAHAPDAARILEAQAAGLAALDPGLRSQLLATLAKDAPTRWGTLPDMLGYKPDEKWLGELNGGLSEVGQGPAQFLTSWGTTDPQKAQALLERIDQAHPGVYHLAFGDLHAEDFKSQRLLGKISGAEPDEIRLEPHQLGRMQHLDNARPHALVGDHLEPPAEGYTRLWRTDTVDARTGAFPERNPRTMANGYVDTRAAVSGRWFTDSLDYAQRYQNGWWDPSLGDSMRSRLSYVDVPTAKLGEWKVTDSPLAMRLWGDSTGKAREFVPPPEEVAKAKRWSMFYGAPRTPDPAYTESMDRLRAAADALSEPRPGTVRLYGHMDNGGMPVSAHRDLGEYLRTAAGHDFDLHMGYADLENEEAALTRYQGGDWHNISPDRMAPLGVLPVEQPQMLQIAQGVEAPHALAAGADRSAAIFHDMLTAPDGRFLHELAGPLARGELPFGHFLSIAPGDLPAGLVGPAMVAIPPEGLFSRMVNKGFGWVGRAVDSMARQPLFIHNFAKGWEATDSFERYLADSELGQRAAPILEHLGADDPHVLDEALRDARMHMEAAAITAAPGDVATRVTAANPLTQRLIDLSGESRDTVGQWVDNAMNVSEARREVAFARAVNDSTPFINDHTVRSQASEHLRNVAPFWWAQESFLRRWGRTLEHTPEALRRGMLLMNGLHTSGIIHSQGGTDYFIYPGSTELTRELSKIPFFGATIPTGLPLTGAVKLTTPGYDRMGVPGLSPLVGIPLGVVAQLHPELAAADKVLQGQNASQSVLDQVVPSTFRRFYTALAGDPERDRTFAASTIGAAASQIAAGNGPPPNASPAELETFKSRIANTSRVIQLTKALVGEFAPAPPGILPDQLHPEFASLLKTVGYRTAISDFVKRYPDADANMVFSTVSASGAPLPLTTQVRTQLETNRDFYTAHSMAAPWLLPQSPSAAPADRSAWNDQVATGLRQARSLDDWVNQYYYQAAAPQYFDKRQTVDAELAKAASNPQARKGIEASWKSWETDYLAQHPYFASKLASTDAHDRRMAVLNEMPLALADPRSPQGDHAQGLSALMGQWQAYTAKVAQLQASPVARTTLGTLIRRNLAADMYNRMVTQVNATPEVADFADTVMYPELAAGLPSLARTLSPPSTHALSKAA